MSVRDKITDVMSNAPAAMSCYELADAILATIIASVPELEWEGPVAGIWDAGKRFKNDNAANGQSCLMPDQKKMWDALRAIAGVIPWPNSEMGFNDLARDALAQKTTPHTKEPDV